MSESTVGAGVKLPASWAVAAIGEVSSLSPKGDFAEIDESQAVHFVPMAAVDENFGGIDISQLRPLSEVRKGYTSFREGDVLFAKITPCMENGKGALVPPLPQQYAFGSTEFHVLRASDSVLPKWLSNYLSQEEFRKVARRNMTGTAGQLRVPSNWLVAAGIPIAPVSEQARIVEKLEELLSDLDAGVAELKAAQRKLAQYRQSLLRAAVEGSMGETSIAHPKRPLGELVKSIGQGWSPRCDRQPSLDDHVWAVIKTTAIQPLCFDGSHNKKLPLNLPPREHLELKIGDLLVTRAGPRSRVGITCLVRHVKKRLILCDKAYRISCDETIIDPEFLELVLNAPHMINQIDSLKTGISDSGLNLTQDRFFTLMIPVPSLVEQRKAIESIETQMVLIEAQEKAVERSLKQATAQRKNILKAAFTGQLVPQNPNEEPASVLLERIRAERAARGTPDIKRGRTARKTA